MATIEPGPGQMIKISRINSNLSELRTLSIHSGLNEMQKTIELHGSNISFHIYANASMNKTTGDITHQITITWKGGPDSEYEKVYEWLTQ